MKKILLSTFLLLWVFLAYSQVSQYSKQQKVPASRAEFILFTGGSYYIGDLNPRNHFKLTQPAGGCGFRYNLDPRLALRLNILIGLVKGDDAVSLSLAQQQRNLQFKSSIFEMSCQTEFNFMKYWMGEFKYLFTHYVFLGAGIFKFRPKAEVNHSWFELQPLTTEGQGTVARPGTKKYKLTQLSVPFGVGVKINVAEQIGLSLEWGMRKTFTDYIDDVSTTYVSPAILTEQSPLSASIADKSKYPEGVNVDNTGRQRGNSQNKDWYSFTGLVLSFAFSKPPPKCYAY